MTEHLDIHEPIALNFIVADEMENITFFNIPPPSNVSVIPSGIFTRFSKLKQVRFQCGLKTIHKDDFKNANNVYLLQLYGNKLEVLPSNVFSEIQKLSRIDLATNQLTTIEDFAFNGSNYLNTIYLQRNNLTTLKRNTFAGAVYLESINLIRNRIATIEDGTFDLPHLKYLYLTRNSIHSLPDNLFVGAPKLVYISVNMNPLTQIGQSFYKSKSLALISLNGDQVEDIDLVSFGKMPSLKILWMKNTGFKFNNISETLASVNSSITQLDLSQNGLSNTDVLSRLERLGYVNLDFLNLERNLFTDIEDIAGIKQKFGKISLLGLSDNRLPCKWIENAVEVLTQQGVSVNNNSEVPPNVHSVNNIICFYQHSDRIPELTKMSLA